MRELTPEDIQIAVANKTFRPHGSRRFRLSAHTKFQLDAACDAMLLRSTTEGEYNNAQVDDGFMGRFPRKKLDVSIINDFQRRACVRFFSIMRASTTSDVMRAMVESQMAFDAKIRALRAAQVYEDEYATTIAADATTFAALAAAVTFASICTVEYTIESVADHFTSHNASRSPVTGAAGSTAAATVVGAAPWVRVVSKRAKRINRRGSNQLCVLGYPKFD